MISSPPPAESHHKSPLQLLALGALGIVYGDIGTSPLYALRECFFGGHGVNVDTANVLGVLSLVFWSLVIVVTLKYHVYVIKFDNHGEGGILALMALVQPARGSERRQGLLLALGLFGAALLYGDGMITPAISVLSAVEGLEVATTFFSPYVVPLTLVILVGLFLFQRRGTGRIGNIFGPIMLLWFATLATLGILGILRDPAVLTALNPAHAVRFLFANGWSGYLVLGAVFLVATGGEALYADLGHFGERAIQIDWFLIVAPALMLNYLGQGALLLHDPAAAANPFYLLAPAWALYPLVLLATAATVIASQAIISGAFSLTRQAVQLRYLPRLNIVHTSPGEIGQIYIPAVNWLLMAATVALVLGFQASTHLAAAYGIAVTTTMVITTLLASVVARQRGWNLALLFAVTAGFLGVDLAFYFANMAKVAHGGWIPLLVALAILVLMRTWKRGQDLISRHLAAGALPIATFVANLGSRPLHRVRGTAVFLVSEPNGTPSALLHNIKHNQVLHDHNVLLTVRTEEIPHVADADRLAVAALGEGFVRITLRYGFMQDPNVLSELLRVDQAILGFDPRQATYFLSRNTLLATGRSGMARWRERLFVLLARNATRPSEFFQLPPNRIVELGQRLELSGEIRQPVRELRAVAPALQLDLGA